MRPSATDVSSVPPDVDTTVLWLEVNTIDIVIKVIKEHKLISGEYGGCPTLLIH